MTSMSVTDTSRVEAAVFDGGAIARRHDQKQRRQRRRSAIVVWSLRLLLLAAVLCPWELLSRSGTLEPLFFSRPSAIVNFLWEYVSSGDIWTHAVATLMATALGFLVGAAAGLPVGLAVGRWSLVERVLAPLIAGLNAMPRVALAPLFVLWFGIGLTSKVMLAGSLVFFIVLVSAEAGVRSVDGELLRMGRSLGAGETMQFKKVVLPSAIPSIFAGLRLGIVYSLLGVVLAEMIGATSGLGQQLALFAGTYQTAGVFALLIVLAALGVSLNSITLSIERRLLRWNR
jgi:NitT/TauT family transport system permease protein